MTSTVPTSATSAQKLVSYTHDTFHGPPAFLCVGQTGQGPFRANLHSWESRPITFCGQRQTTNHIVDTCPFEGGLNLLHEADDDAVIWLESTATAALAKYINKLVSHAKMAEPIEMLFCGTDSCGPKASYIGWGAHRRHLANTIE